MKMTGWLVYRKEDAFKNESFIHWFIEEAERQQIALRLILREDLQVGIQQNQFAVSYQQQPIQVPTLAIVRTVEPQLNALFEQMGMHVCNSSEIARICNHKGLTHLRAQLLGIPMPDTVLTTKDSLGENPPFSFPFVVKEVAGRGGKQVHFISDEERWRKLHTVLSSGDIIMQDSSNVQMGRDIRVFVVGKEIIGAVLRKSDSDFRANFTLGGTAQWYELNQSETDMVETIIRHFDFGMVGIDFLMDSDGKLLFNEIEDVVGSRTLSQVSDINIVRAYVEWIRRTVLQRENH